jgi:hypothetical protein
VVFPDAKDIEANLVGQDNLIQQIVHALDWADGQTRCRVRDDCSEAVDTDYIFVTPDICGPRALDPGPRIDSFGCQERDYGFRSDFP